jgi:hypothetical protein
MISFASSKKFLLYISMKYKLSFELHKFGRSLTSSFLEAEVIEESELKPHS